MTLTALPLIVRLIVNLIAPARWRESLLGDLAEEHHRQKNARGRTNSLWLAGTAFISAVRLRLEPTPASHERRRAGSVFSGFGFALRQACRTLAARPGFTAITVVTLTLGIGANTAVFSLANWLMFRPVQGVADPDRIVTVRFAFESSDGDGFYTMSVPEYRTFARVPGLAGVGAASDQAFHLSTGGVPVRIEGAVVTTNYFDVLGQHMSAGRAFAGSEDEPGNADVAIVSDFLANTQLGGTSAIGRRLTLNGFSFQVIGIAAPGFRGPDRTGRADLWVPLASFRHSMPSNPVTLLTGRIGIFFSLIGRLAPGATLEQVQAQAAIVRDELTAANPKFGKYQHAGFKVLPGLDVPAWQRNGLRQVFALLIGVSGLLLLLTCANVANLIFSRTHERHAELATRQAIGASRGTVIRQLLLEGWLLSVIGGALALGIAMLIGTGVNGLVISRTIPALSSVHLDWRVFAFAAGVSVATCLAAALLPAFVGSRVDLVSSLKTASRSHSSGGRRLRRALTLVQVIVSVVLLALGILLTRSMIARYNVPLGYDPSRVLAFSIDANAQGYPEERQRRLFQSVLETLRQDPAIADAGLAWIQPFRMIGAGKRLIPAGQPDAAAVDADMNMVTDGFFPSLGARFVAGRDFLPAEALAAQAGRERVVILNASMATRLFGTVRADGRHVISDDPGHQTLRVVGVIDDIQTRAVSDAPIQPTVYEPYGQPFFSGWGTFHVRLLGSPAAMSERVRQLMRGVDANLPVYDVERLTDTVNHHLAEPLLLTRTFGAFALLATLVSALGLYGVLSRGVAERRREFGIRSALGARPLAVAVLITREAIAISLAGAAIGVGMAVWVSRYLESRLFGVQHNDPVSLAVAVGVAIVMALVAAAAPARRAARVNVVDELR